MGASHNSARLLVSYYWKWPPELKVFLKNSGLDFTAQALRKNLSEPTKELSDSFRDAYGSTLKPHHSFLVKPIFSAAMSATPYRKDFYAKLGDDPVQSSAALEQWVEALEKRVAILQEFQARKEAKW
jgi:Glycolipid transfer protein (GLTP)